MSNSRRKRPRYPLLFHFWFHEDQRGFTGAEKALLVCFGLAVVSLVGMLLSSGSKQAGGDAQRTLNKGLAAASSGGGMGTVMGAGSLPQAQPIAAAPAAPANVGQLAAVGAVQGGGAVRGAEGPQSIPNGQADSAYDGAYVGAGGRSYPATTPIGQVPPVRPANGQPPNGTIVYVNGIQTTKDAQFQSLQNIANHTGAQVIGIHNSTDGFAQDLAQCVQDKADMGRNPAVDTLANTVYDSISQGRPIHVMGHSQGGLITSRALTHVRRRLMIEDGMTAAQADRTLSLVSVETFGAAAHTYPNGPRYVHYVNRFDPVPSQFGLGSTMLGNWGAGRGAVVRRFNSVHLNPINGHSFDDVYLPRRIPFAQARGRR